MYEHNLNELKDYYLNKFITIQGVKFKVEDIYDEIIKGYRYIFFYGKDKDNNSIEFKFDDILNLYNLPRI